MNDCGKKTPLEHFLSRDSSTSLRCARDNNAWLVAHLNELAESDFELLKEIKTKFHVVHSPRSHDYFDHRRFPFERLHSIGFNVCLGTDSLASNESLSLFAEMRAFQRREPAISPAKILEMVTVNSALALGQQNILGRIRPGFRADLMAIPSAASSDFFAEIVAFEGEINWMMIDGTW
jgi:cytosine/adenosine deaminase-related metal-dependent hydrolase